MNRKNEFEEYLRQKGMLLDQVGGTGLFTPINCKLVLAEKVEGIKVFKPIRIREADLIKV